MAWIRKPHVLERVDALCVEGNGSCSVSVENQLVISGKYDAAVRLLHDMEELVNDALVSGDLVAIENGHEKHRVHVLRKFLPILGGLDLGDVDAHINLDISPTFEIEGTEADKVTSIVAGFRSFVDSADEIVRKSEREFFFVHKSQVAHNRNSTKNTDKL